MGEKACWLLGGCHAFGGEPAIEMEYPDYNIIMCAYAWAYNVIKLCGAGMYNNYVPACCIMPIEV